MATTSDNVTDTDNDNIICLSYNHNKALASITLNIHSRKTHKHHTTTSCCVVINVKFII